MRAFAQAERFVSEVEGKKLRPAYVFVGDEVFFRKKCRDAILQHLVPPDLREFGFFEFDLAETDLAEVLDRARTPSLMAPFQIFFVRGVKTLFGRGSNEEKLNAIEQYCSDPNPDAATAALGRLLDDSALRQRMGATARRRAVEEFSYDVLAARLQAALDGVVARALAAFGHIDIVVANAGTFSHAPAWELSDEQWQNVVDINLTGVWRTANWHERETYDLFGVIFDGHPDLRRILLPDDWQGYALRKDFPLRGYEPYSLE